MRHRYLVDELKDIVRAWEDSDKRVSLVHYIFWSIDPTFIEDIVRVIIKDFPGYWYNKELQERMKTNHEDNLQSVEKSITNLEVMLAIDNDPRIKETLKVLERYRDYLSDEIHDCNVNLNRLKGNE